MLSVILYTKISFAKMILPKELENHGQFGGPYFLDLLKSLLFYISWKYHCVPDNLIPALLHIFIIIKFLSSITWMYTVIKSSKTFNKEPWASVRTLFFMFFFFFLKIALNKNLHKISKCCPKINKMYYSSANGWF